MILIIHTREVTSVGYHKQFLKKSIYRFNNKVRYASKTIDPVINGFIPNEVRRNLHICDHSIVTFCIRGFCLGFSSTYRVDSLDGFRKSVVDKVKRDICI